MKRKLFVILFTLASFFGYSQANASISELLVVTIEEANQKIPEYVVINISSLDFQNQENLDLFCKAFSFDYQKLDGNYSNQELKIQFNVESLNARNIDLVKLNENFVGIAKRMLYVYSNF